MHLKARLSDWTWVQFACVIALIAASFVPILAASKLYKPIDDAYITMTYARSLAEGHGFTFGNNAHPTLGTTTPLNTILLAALYRVFPEANAATITVGLSVVVWIMTGWLWAWQGHVLGLTRFESFFIAILVLVETSIWILHLGMETRLLTFLMTVCLVLYFREAWFWTGILIGLLFLTRGDGILFGAVIGIHQLIGLIRQKQGLNRPILKRWGLIIVGALAVMLPWAIYAYSSFGSILPNTLAAKTAQTAMGFTEPFIVYLAYLFVGDWSNLGFIGGQTGISPWLILTIIGVIYAAYKRPKLVLLVLWCLLYVVGYFLLNIPTYKWYALPVMYIAVVFAGLALASPAELLPRFMQRTTPERMALAGKFVAAILLIGICAILIPQNIPSSPLVDERHDVYEHLAAWTDSQLPAGSSIAYVETGVLAWYSHLRIVDMLGLSNPELIPALKKLDYVAALEQAAPDYLVCSTRFAWACSSIQSSEYFQGHYTLLKQFTGQDLGGTQFPDAEYAIYTRRTDS